MVAFLGEELGKGTRAPAELTAPSPGWSSTLCTSVPSGMFRMGSALPGRISACGPDITMSPGLSPRGAMM